MGRLGTSAMERRSRDHLERLDDLLCRRWHILPSLLLPEKREGVVDLREVSERVECGLIVEN